MTYTYDRRTAGILLDVKNAFKGLEAAFLSVRKLLPGIQLKAQRGRWDYYATAIPEEYFSRLQVPDTGTILGEFPSTNIPFQVGWDVAKRKFIATSFKEEKQFRNLESLLNFVETKTLAFVRKGLRGLPPEVRAFYSGVLTPDSVVKRVLKVEAKFERIDEWHDTSLIILLMLSTSKNVPEKLIETWLKNHWQEVKALAPNKTPRPAGNQSYEDQPPAGLGWLIPGKMEWQDVDDLIINQEGNRATVHASGSVR